MKTTMPMLFRADAAFQPKSWNEDARTVELVWTTGARVRRNDWLDGEYEEELVVTEEAVDMGRLMSGNAPLLAAHDSDSLSSIIGVVESAWILGPNGRKEGRAKVRFSSRADVEPILQDVRDGIIRNVSVGYRVHNWEKRQAKGDDVPVMRAVRWEPYELSLVPIPADGRSQVRTGQGEVFPTTIEEIEMERHVAESGSGGAAETEVLEPVVETQAEVETQVEEPVERAAPPVDTRAIAEDAIRVERERCAGINLTCRKLGVDPKLGEKLIADGVPLDAARARLIDLVADQHKDTAVNIPAQIIRDGGETKVDAMRDAILFRAGRAPKLTDAAREHGYQHLRLIDMAREVLEENGVSRAALRAMPPMQIAELAMRPGHCRMSGGLHTTSDFANILSSTINTTLRQAYGEAPRTFTVWARQTTAADFRAINRVQLSSAPRLSRVGENGEYTRGTMTDSKESYQVTTYGKIIGLTRQVIVNDYLDAFGRVPTAMASAAASLESDIVYKVLLANAAMADGVTLFHSNHGNVGTAGTISVTTINEGYGLMAVQLNANGSPMNLSPQFLLMPPGIRAAGEQLVNSVIVPEQQSNAIPAYMRGLTPVTEARLATGVTIDGSTTSGDTNGWYLLASTSQVDTVEYAYLEGYEGVYTEERNGFEVDGVEVKVRLDFGAAAIDHRGMVSNAGA